MGTTSTSRTDATAGVPDDVSALLGADQLAWWNLPRAFHRPEVWQVVVDGAPAALALTSGRPTTAYRKVVDVWVAPGGDAAGHATALAALLDAVVADAAERGLAGVKVEVHPWSAWLADAPELAAAGFAPLRDPIASSAGTLGGVRGFVRWLDPWPHPELTYYGQTTDFTCGAVAGLAALERAGLTTLTGAAADETEAVEMALWRAATNFPACEPLGLVVATTERLRAAGRTAQPEVFLSTDQPVMLDLGGGDAAGLRAMLQRQSLERAVQLGIPVHRSWLPLDGVEDHLAEGSGLLLLIDDVHMVDDPTPHWVFAHAVHGRHVLIQDPWTDVDAGETWVDGHELPLSLDDLDTMTRYGEPEYRGVIVVPA